MNTKTIHALLDKYYRGETTLDEERALRTYFREHDRQALPPALQTQADLFSRLEEAGAQEPESFDPMAKIEPQGDTGNINQPISYELRPQRHSAAWTWSLRIAAGIVLLLAGFAAGQFLGGGNEYASTRQVAQLEQEVQQMKQALMNSGSYRTVSAGERLSAVNLSTRIPADEQRLDNQITDILAYTMNNDQSVNVRIAAAEALFRFRSDPRVKNALVRSLTQQDDPLMQITLIDMLVELKASGAVNEMKKLLVDTDTQEMVRQRLEVGIARLKT